ncbi:DoxX family protein [Saprospira grandis]|uniref:DoxX family protein n=1 Tax=Saprospira grandis (strain Lewin) TaxID=984262 RepID=H6KZ00_SAPGL|nr:membrane protein [Saprospira grandis]AFC23284.1 hypothetical protein SGRA_0545 [Saprospira grandis str. Lewin]
MKPLILLVSVFLLLLFIQKWRKQPLAYFVAGRWALSAMFLFTAVAHFVFSEGMALMLASYIPYPFFWVYLTGIIEILAAIGLQIRAVQRLTALLLIIFLILILPANIYAALQTVNYQTASFDGPGLSYLYFRIPLQLFYIFCCWFFGFASKK